jgi:toxin YoeB
METGKEKKYTLIFTDVSLKDLAFHDKEGNRATIKRIDRILQELETTPFVGIGKPHPLSYQYAGLWSRHLNKKDVLVYEVNETEKSVQIYSARYHYSDK